MRIAYFDCFAGAAGDMIVAAMIDAGLDVEFLTDQLDSLGIEGLAINVDAAQRCGIKAVSFAPVVSPQKQHRNLEQITDIINKSKITKKAKETAGRIFNRLAQAEAVVHGRDVQQIHFHEVGAVDAIVDVVSAAIGLEALDIEKVYCSDISTGGGTVKCEHGLLPVPAPATAELLKGVPVTAGPEQAELLTPTGAAVLTEIVDEFRPLPAMKIEKIGYGAGRMDSDKFPNVVRLILGQTAGVDSAETDCVCLMETNVDDLSGELLGLTVERLFGKGAVDVFTAPIYMKHNRPAVKLSVICKLADIQSIERFVFEQGITLGIRKQLLERSKLARKFVTVKTRFGDVKVKLGLLGGKVVSAKPEFSDCVALAQKHEVAVRAVLDAANAACDKLRYEQDK